MATSCQEDVVAAAADHLSASMGEKIKVLETDQQWAAWPKMWRWLHLTSWKRMSLPFPIQSRNLNGRAERHREPENRGFGPPFAKFPRSLNHQVLVATNVPRNLPMCQRIDPSKRTIHGCASRSTRKMYGRGSPNGRIEGLIFQALSFFWEEKSGEYLPEAWAESESKSGWILKAALVKKLPPWKLDKA